MQQEGETAANGTVPVTGGDVQMAEESTKIDKPKDENLVEDNDVDIEADMPGSEPSGFVLRFENVRKAFIDLKEKHSIISRCIVQWEDLENYFKSVEESLQKREWSLQEREKNFSELEKERTASFELRESTLASREKDSAQRVQELKDAAFAVIAEERKKVAEERAKASDIRDKTLEQAVERALAKSGKTGKSEGISKREENAKSPKDSEVGDKVVDSQLATDDSSPKEEVKDVPTGNSESVEIDEEDVKSKKDSQEKAKESVASEVQDAGHEKKKEVQVRPELKSVCEAMDADGLKKLIVDNKRNIAALKVEIPAALKHAMDPPRLILMAVEGYKPYGKDKKEVRKEPVDPSQVRSCILLIESLDQVFDEQAKEEGSRPVIAASIRDMAKGIANSWIKAGIVPRESSTLDVSVLLQLLSTFQIASEYSTDELLKYVSTIVRRKQTPELCKSLGLTEKIPGLVKQLEQEGKYLEAIQLAYDFKLLNDIEPVGMIKKFIRETRTDVNEISRRKTPGAENEAANKETAAVRSAIRLIEDCKLESKYPLESLRKRLKIIEEERKDRKRAASIFKANAKRPKFSQDQSNFHSPPVIPLPVASPTGPRGRGSGGRRVNDQRHNSSRYSSMPAPEAQAQTFASPGAYNSPGSILTYSTGTPGSHFKLGGQTSVVYTTSGNDAAYGGLGSGVASFERQPVGGGGATVSYIADARSLGSLGVSRQYGDVAPTEVYTTYDGRVQTVNAGQNPVYELSYHNQSGGNPAFRQY